MAAMNDTVYGSQTASEAVDRCGAAPFGAHHGAFPKFPGIPGIAPFDAVSAPFAAPNALNLAPRQNAVQLRSEQPQQALSPRAIPRGHGLSTACPSPFGPPPGTKPNVLSLPQMPAMPHFASPTTTNYSNSHPMAFWNDSDGNDGRNAFPLSFHRDANHSPFGLGDDEFARLESPRPPTSKRCPFMKMMNLSHGTPAMQCPMRGLIRNTANGVHAANTMHSVHAINTMDAMNTMNSMDAVNALDAAPGPTQQLQHHPLSVSTASVDATSSAHSVPPQCPLGTEPAAKRKESGRKRPRREFVADENEEEMDDDDDEQNQSGNNVEEETYPEVGVRATATIQMAKELFVGHEAMHRAIAREMVLEALRQIAECRWFHEKYGIEADSVRYLVFLDEDLAVPPEFRESKPRRGRPPKHKKQRTEEGGKDMREWNGERGRDKLYRLNFQIVFEHKVAAQAMAEIVQCIQIDLNRDSLSMLMSKVLAADIAVTDRVQSYSLYAVEAGKLREYERYESEEEARKKKKREREQRRRENKKREMLRAQSSSS